MALRIYDITLTGTQPLLMHADDIEWADQMESWRADKDNKKVSRAGDDRSPAFRWIGSLYHMEFADAEGKRDLVAIPAENIMRALMEGGANVPVPGAKNGKTFKAQSQSGIMPRDLGWPLQIDGKTIDFGKLNFLMAEPDFAKHKAHAEDFGFQLFVKRARIGASKHVRVRPRFDAWSASGQLTVTDDQLTTAVLCDILEFAGKYKGLGDWRPSSKTPGTFGMFTATVSEV